MKFLLDENLSPLLAELLVTAGYDVVHARDLGLLRAPDQVVMDRARAEGRVLVSADTDFGQLLAASHASSPSVVLLRREIDRRASSQTQLLLANLDQVAPDLEEGAIVVMEASRRRVRKLPI